MGSVKSARMHVMYVAAGVCSNNAQTEWLTFFLTVHEQTASSRYFVCECATERHVSTTTHIQEGRKAPTVDFQRRSVAISFTVKKMKNGALPYQTMSNARKSPSVNSRKLELCTVTVCIRLTSPHGVFAGYDTHRHICRQVEADVSILN